MEMTFHDYMLPVGYITTLLLLIYYYVITKRSDPQVGFVCLLCHLKNY